MGGEIFIQLEDLLQKPFYFLINKKCKNRLITQSIKKEGNLKNVAARIGCSITALREHMRLTGRYLKAESLRTLSSTSGISLKEIEKNVVALKRGCSNREVEISLPVVRTTELALLIAKVFGDGSILSDWRFHYTNNQKDLINEVIKAVEKAIGKSRSTLHKRKNRGVYEIKFSPVIGFILFLAGGVRGHKISQEFQVPFWITKGDQEIKLSFLRGIFDDEATVNYDQKRHNRRVILAMGKKLIYKQSLIGFMGQIKDLLTTSGVQTGKICAQEVYGDRIMLRFGIYRRQSLENFLYKIGFTHKRKAKILRDMTHTYLGVNTSKKKILETITKSTKPLTTREIAKITHLKYSTVKFHVRDMFDQSMIDKIEERPCRWI